MKSKLTQDQVAEIKGGDESCRVLASRYGVSAGRIWQIRQGDRFLVKQRKANRLWNAWPELKARLLKNQERRIGA